MICMRAMHATLKLHRLQVGLGGKSFRFIARVNDATIDDDVELATLAGLHVHGSTSKSFDPSLHTEGFGFVASGGAVVNDRCHDHCLSQLPLGGTEGDYRRIASRRLAGRGRIAPLARGSRLTARKKYTNTTRNIAPAAAACNGSRPETTCSHDENAAKVKQSPRPNSNKSGKRRHLARDINPAESAIIPAEMARYSAKGMWRGDKNWNT